MKTPRKTSFWVIVLFLNLVAILTHAILYTISPFHSFVSMAIHTFFVVVFLPIDKNNLK